MNAQRYFRPNVQALQPYVPGRQAAPGKTIKLNTNENPYPPPPAVVEAIRQAAGGSLNRYPDPLASGLRMAIAKTLDLPGPEWVLAGNGSDEILTLLVRGLVGENQQLRLPTPSYILYRTLADIQAAQWDEVPFEPDWSLPDSFWQSDPNVRLVMLPNPNSPSGSVVAPEEIEQRSQDLHCPLLVDEAYADFADSNCLDLVRRNEHIMVSRTFSKSYALAGVRMGYLVAQPSLIEQLIKIKDSYNCDALAIAAATAAMLSQDWLSDVVAKIRTTRERMWSRLQEMGFDVLPSQGNFVWCTHPSARHAWMHEQLSQSQILIRYMNYPGFGDGLRISVGTDDQIDACLMMLQRLVRQCEVTS
ncbi:MAG: histidinol-phosphate transaminase [Planctomycetota bacterium]